LGVVVVGGSGPVFERAVAAGEPEASAYAAAKPRTVKTTNAATGRRVDARFFRRR
jgi:hypothetical protein